MKNVALLVINNESSNSGILNQVHKTLKRMIPINNDSCIELVEKPWQPFWMVISQQITTCYSTLSTEITGVRTSICLLQHFCVLNNVN